MSLVMPIFIGDATIGALTIGRTTRLRNGSNDVHTYNYELHIKAGKTLRGNRPEESHAGSVEHSYADGAVELIKKVFAQIP